MVALFAVVPVLRAQQVIMKDGTVYSGYVSEQSPKSEKMTITYTSAEFCLPLDTLQITNYGDRVSIRCGNALYDNVTILEDGDRVTFKTYTSGSVIVTRRQIESISYPVNPLVNDVIRADYTYEGNMTGVIVGDYVKKVVGGKAKETVVGSYVKMDVGEKKKVISDGKIKIHSKVSVDKDKPLNVKMFPYLETYSVSNMPALTGAMISSNYQNGTVSFLTREGELVSFSMKEVSSISRIPNEEYTLPAEVDTVEVRVDNKIPKWLEVKADKKEMLSFSVEQLAQSLTIVTWESLYVSVIKDEKKKLNLSLIPFDPFSSKSGIMTLGKPEDLKKEALKPANQEIWSEREETCYENLKNGFYLLWDSAGKRVAPILMNNN